MAQTSLIEGISDNALAVMAICFSSVAWFLWCEYSKAMNTSESDSGPALQALYAYVMGYSEPQTTQTTGVPRTRASPASNEESEARNEGSEADRAAHTNRSECPICLDQVSYAVETSCGHAFCGKCFCEYWQASNGCRRRLACPLDRRQIYSVYPSRALRAMDVSEDPMSMPAALYQEIVNNRRRVDDSLGLYNRMFGSGTEDLRWVARALRQWGSVSLGLRTYVKLLLFLVFLYFICPFDILPESFVGPAGMIDDLILLIFVLCHLGGAFRTAVLLHGISRGPFRVGASLRR